MKLRKRKLKWVEIKVFNRVIWIKREEITDVQYMGVLQRDGQTIKLYKVFLSDGSVIPQCELESDEIYEELIKKDLTKDK
jgi:hypothetical protein